LGLAGVLLLFYFGMPGAVKTGGRPIIVGNPTPQSQAEELRNTILGYVGLALTVLGALCAIAAAYS
jgi:hypothetical protein